MNLAGAAIDVYPAEPEKNGDVFITPLQGLSNVILTPHIGGSTEEAQQNIGEDVSSKLFNFLGKRNYYRVAYSSCIKSSSTGRNTRILHIHKNVPGVLSEINTQLSQHKINILGAIS